MKWQKFQHPFWHAIMPGVGIGPGYGGQPFESSIYEKLRRVREIMKEEGRQVPISVDGGVNVSTGRRLVDTGADLLISNMNLYYTFPFQFLLISFKASMVSSCISGG